MISTSVPSFAHPLQQVRLGVIGRGLPGERLSECSSGRPESGDQGRIAWRGLCAAYLGSMRFLTY